MLIAEKVRRPNRNTEIRKRDLEAKRIEAIVHIIIVHNAQYPRKVITLLSK